jgi:hypothetical protein
MSFLGAQNSIALGVQGLIHIDTGVVGSADYLLAKSLRFRFSASAYLSRTPAVAGNLTTWTWSAWIKRGTLSVAQDIFGYFDLTVSNFQNRIVFNADNTFEFLQFNTLLGGYTLRKNTAQVFRDPSAWYHIVCVFDSTNAIAEDGARVYVNGNRITSWANNTLPAASLNSYINSNLYPLGFGIARPSGSNYFDGELAEINFVDGQALLPASFGASSTYNQWLPIAYAGPYGTNGFYLPFTNVTSTSTLVADSSGNANNWTPNNISLTAGSTYDSLTDVPTLTSTTVANYAVLNPLETLYRAAVISNGNLTYDYPSTGGSNSAPAISTIAISSGTKVYFELVSTTSLYPLGSGIRAVGTIATSNQYLGYAATEYAVTTNGNKVSNNVSTAYGTGLTAGDVIGCAVDLVNGKIYWSKNGAWFNSGDPAVGTNPAFTGLSGNYFACVGTMAGANTCTGSVNFGQQPFTYTPPSGFLPLNTFNIAAGTVTTSGTFTGNLSTDGPFVFLNGTPTAMTINGNAVTFGTHADKLANGFKVRSSSASYNASGSNTYVATTVGAVFKYEDAQGNP